MNLRQVTNAIDEGVFIKESDFNKYKSSIKTYVENQYKGDAIVIPYGVANIGIIGGVLVCGVDDYHESLVDYVKDYYTLSEKEQEEAIQDFMLHAFFLK